MLNSTLRIAFVAAMVLSPAVAAADFKICARAPQCTVRALTCLGGETTVAEGFADKWAACRAITDGSRPDINAVCPNPPNGCGTP